MERTQLHIELLMAVGNRIKTIRKDKKISQYALALDCDMEKSSMSKIEAGKVNSSYLTLHRISHALNIPVANILC